MVLKCPACSQTFTVPDGVTSGKAKCPQCGQRLDLGRMLRPGDLRPGTVLGGCRIEGVLGRGGMATVYKATQISLERPVALKVLPTRFASNPQFVERFNREASALALLAHPNIVGILDKGVEGETYYFVMEYVEGKSLRDRLLREGKLSAQETRQLVQGVCAGLAYAHENGVVHRDLKPGNILLDGAGTPKLADFGIARLTGTDTQEGYQLTEAHTVMGSADYMAPEQRADAANADHRADIYSLGVMLYQTLTGQLPVGSFKPVAHLVPGVPTAVDRVVRTALASAPDDRYDSVGKFLFALNHAFDETAAARHAPRVAVQARRRKTPTAVAVLVAAAAMAVVVGLVALVRPRGRAEPPPPPPPPSTNHKVVRTATRVTTPHVVRPKPPEPMPKKAPPPPGEEPAAVRQALAGIREYIAAHPDDYPTQVQRLKDILLNHGNPQVLVAARKEMNAVGERLDKAIAEHFAGARKRADALMAQRAYGAAVRLVGTLPPNLFTSEAKKEADGLVQEYRGKCWTAFGHDCKRAAALVEAGKIAEAAAVLSVAYPSAELQKLAAEELAKLKQALAAQQERVRKEQAKLRADLTVRLKALWADRCYPEGPPLAKQALAQAPDEPSRAALAPHARAAALLDALWKATLEAVAARKGGYITLANSKYVVKDVDGESVVLTLGEGRGEVKRELRKQSTEDLYLLARDWLDTAKKADDNLMLGLFFTYEGKPDPAAAARAFEKAIGLGAAPQLVAALRDLNGASTAPDVKEHDPKEKEPEPPAVAGYALDLSGVSDYVDVPDERRKRSLRLKAFTAEAWAWRRPLPAEALPRYVLAKNAGWTDSLSFAIYVEDGCWAYATGDGVEGDPVVTRVPCPTGVWSHCALVYEEGFRTLFVDGKQAHRSRGKRRIGFDDQPLYVGAVGLDGNAAHFWGGGIDEVRITNGVRYRKDFTPERELKADDATHLLLHADDGKGLRVKDSSRFENHGVLRGAAAFLAPGDFKVRRPGPPAPPPKGPPVKQPPAGPAPPKAGPGN
ncbi:MAG TPA: protein kinase [Planctomycetota bacterium]|nr:protein kinase [Planctomycetota bacterium]